MDHNGEDTSGMGLVPYSLLLLLNTRFSSRCGVVCAVLSAIVSSSVIRMEPEAAGSGERVVGFVLVGFSATIVSRSLSFEKVSFLLDADFLLNWNWSCTL